MGLVAVHLGRTVMSTLGEDALARLIERIRLARGISRPVLDALRRSPRSADARSASSSPKYVCAPSLHAS